MTMCAEHRRWPWSNYSRGMLYRYPRDGRIAGVCAGLARYFDVSPFWARVATIGLFFLIGPFAIFAYIVAALALPTREDDGRSPWDRPWHRDEIKREAKRAYHEARRAWKFAGRGGYGFPSSDGDAARTDRATATPSPNAEALRTHLRDLERRIAVMEAHIADREFNLAKAIDDLERK